MGNATKFDPHATDNFKCWPLFSAANEHHPIHWPFVVKKNDAKN